jgi:hypothetical protein
MTWGPRKIEFFDFTLFAASQSWGDLRVRGYLIQSKQITYFFAEISAHKENT